MVGQVGRVRTHRTFKGHPAEKSCEKVRNRPWKHVQPPGRSSVGQGPSGR
jgi:hypothetical protein